MLVGCPMERVLPVAWDTLNMTDLHAKGTPPVLGGSLDQTSSYLAAARLVWALESPLKAKLRLTD